MFLLAGGSHSAWSESLAAVQLLRATMGTPAHPAALFSDSAALSLLADEPSTGAAPHRLWDLHRPLRVAPLLRAQLSSHADAWAADAAVLPWVLKLSMLLDTPFSERTIYLDSVGRPR